MARVVGIGKQDYSEIIENDCFYIDRTAFIKEWWESQDDVTLLNRPRRFGKTLTLSMLYQFFRLHMQGAVICLIRWIFGKKTNTAGCRVPVQLSL